MANTTFMIVGLAIGLGFFCPNLGEAAEGLTIEASSNGRLLEIRKSGENHRDNEGDCPPGYVEWGIGENIICILDPYGRNGGQSKDFRLDQEIVATDDRR